MMTEVEASTLRFDWKNPAAAFGTSLKLLKDFLDQPLNFRTELCRRWTHR